MIREKINFYLRNLIIFLMLLFGSIEIISIFKNFEHQWYWLILASIYTIIINDIFCHRICSHNMFKIDTRSYLYKFLTWMASSDMGYGPVKWIILSHNLHHIHSDKGPEDVMNWRYHWYSTTIVSPIPRNDVKPLNYDKYIENQKIKNKVLIEDKWTNFCADHQVVISIVTFAFLFLVFPILLFKVILVGRVMLTIMTGLAGFVGHIKNFPGSYRNHDTDDTTSNNIIFHLLFLGLFAGMLQNNHHGRPQSEKPNNRWWEVDSSWIFVKLLRLGMENKHEKMA